MGLELVEPEVLVEVLDAEVLDDVLLPRDLAVAVLDLGLELRDGRLGLLRGPALNAAVVLNQSRSGIFGRNDVEQVLRRRAHRLVAVVDWLVCLEVDFLVVLAEDEPIHFDIDCLNLMIITEPPAELINHFRKATAMHTLNFEGTLPKPYSRSLSLPITIEETNWHESKYANCWSELLVEQLLINSWLFLLKPSSVQDCSTSVCKISKATGFPDNYHGRIFDLVDKLKTQQLTPLRTCAGDTASTRRSVIRLPIIDLLLLHLKSRFLSKQL